MGISGQNQYLLAHRLAAFKKLLIDALLWAALGAFIIAGFRNSAKIEPYSAISLRFGELISSQAAYNARLYSISNGATFWPTFWREGSAKFTTGTGEANAPYIAISGDAALVWPTTYICGSSSGATDGAGCSISSGLAWRLFGSNDVVGMSLKVDGEERVVRGVFDFGGELALVSYAVEGFGQSWAGAELFGGPSSPLRADAASFAISSGLGSPGSILIGGSVVFFAKAMASLPLLILGGYAAALVYNMVSKMASLAKSVCAIGFLIVFAMWLPSFLEILPPWMVPTKWSDFSFWSGLWQGAKDGLVEYLGMAPAHKDVQVRLLVLNQTLLSLAASLLALSCCFRWGARRKELLGAGIQKIVSDNRGDSWLALY
ncbi:MAG: hypothetical protein FWG10_05090 [Eubacteriaceae bacterium]|nr:hypothetical protein [Eubacteriaceae bacterium]